METEPYIGYIDGSADATTQRFTVVLQDDALVQLDDLLVSEQDLPGNRGSLKALRDRRRRPRGHRRRVDFERYATHLWNQNDARQPG